LRHITLIVVTIVITPFILKKIGVKDFGVWSLILAFSNIPVMLQLGVGSALDKFIPDLQVNGDTDDINRMINFALIFYAVIGLFSLLIIFLFKDMILYKFIKIDSSEYSTINFILVANLLLTWLNFVLWPYVTILTSFQKYDDYAFVGIFECIGRNVLIFFFLILGWGLYGMVFASLGSVVITFFSSYYFVSKVFPQFKLQFVWPKFKTTGKELLGYGINLGIPSLADMLQQNLDKILLGFFLNNNYVSYYQLGSGLARQIKSIPDNILIPILPTASELNALNDKDKINKLYFKAQKYNLFILLPLLGIVFIFAPTIIKLWLGQGFSLVVFTFRFFVLAFIVNVLSRPPYLILNALGFPQEGMKSSILAIIISIGVCPVLIWKFGYSGALLGTSLSIIIPSIWLKCIFHKKLSFPFLSMVKMNFIVPAIAVCVASIAVFTMKHFIENNIIGQLLLIIMFIVIYFILILLSKHYTKDEYSLMIGTFRKFFG